MIFVVIWYLLLTGSLFVLGIAVGSFLNVCIYRIPQGRSLVWPGSRCGRCCARIRASDNIPLLSYWLLGGRCRACKAPYSMRYFFVELLTGLMLPTLYHLEIGQNLQGLPLWPTDGYAYLHAAQFPPHSGAFFAFHALLAALLLVSVGCLLDTGEVPRALALVGGVSGLIFALWYPWPAPESGLSSISGLILPCDGDWDGQPLRGEMPTDRSWSDGPVSPRPGFMPWPIWGPLPAGGYLSHGLFAGLAGMILGAWLLRGVGWIHRKLTGDDHVRGAATVVFMVGGFLGWQPVLVALLLAVLHYLPMKLSAAGDRASFTFCVVLGLVMAWLGWPWVGPLVRVWLFHPLGGVSAVAVVLGMLLLVGCPSRAET